VPSGTLLRKHHLICELHFKEVDIEKEFVHTMSDGSVYRLKKQRPSLKKGSVPSIFPVNPDNIENNRLTVCFKECVVPRNIRREFFIFFVFYNYKLRCEY